jgi:hypothetical protein
MFSVIVSAVDHADVLGMSVQVEARMEGNWQEVESPEAGVGIAPQQVVVLGLEGRIVEGGGSYGGERGYVDIHYQCGHLGWVYPVLGNKLNSKT